VGSNAFPVIARPFFAPNQPVPGSPFGEAAELVAVGPTRGALQVVQSSFLWGADVNLRNCICRTCSSRSEWFVGFRYLDLQESLTVTEFITSGGNFPNVAAGTGKVVRDDFRTTNRFYGGQVGYAVGQRRGRVDVDVRASVALGGTAQTLAITGTTQAAVPGQAPTVFPTGGLLAAGPNLGSFNRNRFSVVPEVTVNVGYLLTPALRAYVGYNFLYWSNVLRPGEQIDRVVDLSFVPSAQGFQFSGQARPQPTFRQSDLWAQGLQFGLELRW
jgi:hypothetical protein